MMLPTMRIAALAGVLVVIGACASEIGVFQLYNGPRQPDSAVARIYVPADVGVVSVDERSVLTLLSGDQVELQVLPGAHRITLRYYRIFESRSESIRKIISDPVTKSLTVRAGHQYRVEHDSPQTLESAQTYAPNFDYRIREVGAAGQAGAIVAAEAVQKSMAATVSEIAPAGRTPLEQLKYWWGQAGDVDRQDFRRWIQAP